IRYVIGHSTMDDILTGGREVIRARVEQELQAIVEPYQMGVAVVGLNFSNSRPPEEVRAAFDDAIAAQEDQERFIQEAEAYAREREPAARGEVNRINEEAQAYKEQIILEAQGEVARFEELLPQFEAAPEVTRQRIYIETMEQVFGNTSKVMVDTDGSGNLMYLPLDKIMQQSNTQNNLQNSANNRLQEILNDRSNASTRESSSTRGSTGRQGRN
ncbi:MAG: FtsH protease activity modulator HflK, partial [Pseudomonadota bacterium]